MRKMLRAYAKDVAVVLGRSDRDSRGRFVKGNRYRFGRVRMVVCGVSGSFLAQSAAAGSFLRAVKG